ncbi:MAG: heavy metal-binding domain-containing protein [Bacteroidota bacterium]
MKKFNLTLAVLVIFGLAITSCNQTKKEDVNKEITEVNTEVTEEAQELKEVTESEEIAMAVYACPMKCEAEKTYSEEGSCPKCNMDLKKVETEEENHEEKAPEAENHEGEDHNEKDHE